MHTLAQYSSFKGERETARLGAADSMLRFLLSRSSVAPQTLIAPGPSAGEIYLMIAAAVAAPDHAALRPWRFIAIERDGRRQLSRVLVELRRRRDPRAGPAELAATWRKTMSAPALIAVVARLDPLHAKVPLHEQYVSVGASIYALMLGAQAFGYGAILLSGDRARDPMIHALFGLAAHEQIIGFVSMGTPSKKIMPKKRPAPSDHLQIWNGDEDFAFGQEPASAKQPLREKIEL